MKRLLFFLIAAGVFFSGFQIPVGAVADILVEKRYVACMAEFGEPEYCADVSDFTVAPAPKPKVVYPDNLGEPFSNGYFSFPEAEDNEYGFTWFSWEYLRCGSEELIGVVYTAIIEFNKKYPDTTILIGEVNAPGHKTHNRGVDIDVSGWENDAQVIAFGKALVDTGRLNYIIYKDRGVNAEINAYAASVGEKEPMRQRWDHSHFHISIDKEFAGPRSTKCGRNW